MKKRAGGWKNRIIGEADVAPDQLLANPLNWRIHPKFQQDALRGVLSDVGWVQRIIVNQSTGNIIDGHLRVSLALRHGAKTVPVVYVELSEDEENEILATLDPLGAMAGTDRSKLDELLQVVSSQDEAVIAMLGELSKMTQPPQSESSEAEADDADNLEGQLENPEFPAADSLQIGLFKPKWNKMRTTRFFSLRVWNLRDKKNELERYKAVKKDVLDKDVEKISEEFNQTIKETFQSLPNILVTCTPFWNGSEKNQLKEKIAERLAKKIGGEYKKIFADRFLSGSNHPKNYDERGKITLQEPVASKIIVLVEDLVVSGVTIEESITALAGNFVIPMAWLYENTEKEAMGSGTASSSVSRYYPV